MNKKCTKCSCGCGSRKECGICSENCGCACGKNKQGDSTQEEEEPQSIEQGSIKYGPERVTEAFQEGIRQDELMQEKSESY